MATLSARTETGNDTIPVVVRGPKLDCNFCVRNGFKRSEECQQCFIKHGIVKCVYEVSENDVRNAIDQMILDLNLGK